MSTLSSTKLQIEMEILWSDEEGGGGTLFFNNQHYDLYNITLLPPPPPQNQETLTDSYYVSGSISRLDDITVEITELPLKTWTQPYKEFLEGLMDTGTGKDKKVGTCLYKVHHR